MDALQDTPHVLARRMAKGGTPHARSSQRCLECLRVRAITTERGAYVAGLVVPGGASRGAFLPRPRASFFFQYSWIMGKIILYI